MICPSSLNIPLFEPKPTEMRFIDQELSLDAFISIRGRLQQNPPDMTNQTDGTCFVQGGIHKTDEPRDDGTLMANQGDENNKDKFPQKRKTCLVAMKTMAIGKSNDNFDRSTLLPPQNNDLL